MATLRGRMRAADDDVRSGLRASLERRTWAIGAQAFAFVTGDDDIARVREFIGALPELLGGR